ncbi:MAG: hypothetical protein ABIJ40_00115, partial [Bacteroidota bacterium]
TVVNSVASSLGSYTYTVPDLPTNNARIRISGITNPTLIDVSDNKFTIGTISATEPDGGEIWQAGTVESIKWTVSNGINAVKIEYSQDGLTWTTITPTTNALAGNYNWSIPSSLSANTVRIRVSDAATGLGINDVSNLFTIAKLTLTTPNGGELWESGTSQNIQWSASASLTNIRIQYSTNAGGSWSNIASNVPAVNNSYAWNIPTDIGSASMRVKLFAENDSTFYTTSGFNFKVAKVNLISPNGGERLFANSPHVVSWTATSGIDFVTLQYSTNGGVSFINIANRINASQGSYSWTVPDISSSTGKVRIYDSFGSSISDVSETDFSIARIKVTSPNGGEGFLIGSNQKIKWTASLVDNVKIDYSLDNGTTWINIQNGVAASADSITWITPSVATSTGLVRVSDINNSNHSDKSDANFKIANIEVVSPNGGERLASARTQTITWNNSTNITSVNIDLSTNNGTSWINVSSSVPATGTYSWSVGDIASSNSIIRITDASNTNIFDRSDAVFTLKKLLLTSPNGNEYYLVDTTTSVSWSSLGVSNVKLEYSTNSGVTWKSIINSTPAVPNNYSWKIPNDPSTTALVRALDVDDPTTVADTSNNSFIINQVLLVSPNGGQTFEVGSVQTIKWNNYSGVSKVDLEFFNGNSWSAIASGLTASNKSYQWTVPASVTSTAKVRVKNTDDSNVFDGSDNVFSIGTINLTAPNGGGKYLVGKSTNITWKNIISVSQVNLDYSIDNGTTWISIAAGITASKETYTWTIPNTPSTQVLVRISDASNSAVNDLSENTFSIATITLTAPNGGEKIQVGNNFAVTWTSENVSFVNIEYSTDNGLTWATISSNVNAGAGILQWTVQNTPSSNALVRITDASFNTVTDRSDAIFDILYLNLTAPDGGEKLLVGTQSNITWSSNNSISKVNIEYTTNNGNSWTSIQTGVTASLGTYDWTVPNTPSTSVKVQVVDQNNPTIIDASANVLTIAALKLNAPNGGEKIQVGKNYPITWTSQNISTINIEYSTDNGVSWTTISSGVNTGAGILQWAVLNTPSSNALVRITDAAFSSVTDRSDSIFSILALELASPNGGEKYLVGNQTDITWNNSSSISQVNLEYSTNSGTSWISIQSGLTASTQKYTWTIPNTTSTNVYVRVADANNTSVLDASDDKFTIAKLAVTSPNGGNKIQVGKNFPITWTSTNVTTINLDYSTDNGSTWASVQNNVNAGLGILQWAVPNTASSNALLRITDASSSLVTDRSDSAFSILAIELTSPNGGEKYLVNNQVDIKWANSLSITKVDLDYSTNNGTSWISIQTSITASLEKYTWTIPNTSSTNMLVRVKDTENPTILDASNSIFTIASLIVTSPNGGEKVQVGKSVSITWTSQNVSLVDLHYSLDNGASWTSIASNLNAGAGIYQWTVPNSPSSNALIRVTDSAANLVQDQSDAKFNILSLAITSPLGSEVWEVGATKNITWTQSGIGTLKIQYSSNNGTSWNLIDDSVNPTLLSKSWVLPNAPGSQTLVKLSDKSDSTISSVSSAFTIGEITITAPTAGISWKAGTSQNIKWTASSVVSTVNLEYSTDGGSNWTSIKTGVRGDLGAYSWTIPSGISTLIAKVRVNHSLAGSEISTESSSFTINSLDLTAPNGGEIWQAGTVQKITWTSSVITNIKIDYSTNNGTSWVNIIPSTSASSGSYDWTLPPTLSSAQGLIKISDAANSTVKDSSAGTIKFGWVDLTSPAQDSIWQSTKNKIITWTASSSISTIKLEYSDDDGSTWQDIISGVAAANNSYTWKVGSNLNSSNSRIRISDAASSLAIKDISDKFKFVYLNLTSPIGGEDWQEGSLHPITWTAGNLISLVNIYYSTNSGTSWNTIASSVNASLGTKDWIIPAGTASANSVIKIE